MQVLRETLKSPGRHLPRPRYPTLADPRELTPGEVIKFFVQKSDTHLHDAVSAGATPAHVLALAHSTPSDAIDGRFDEAC